MKTLLLGIAVGVAVGYLLATEDTDEIIAGAKKAARKAKDLWDEGLEKGKEAVSDFKESRNNPSR